MSRAFVKEDAGWGDPGKRYTLPERGDPDYDEACRLGREYREQQTYDKEIAGS